MTETIYKGLDLYKMGLPEILADLTKKSVEKEVGKPFSEMSELELLAVLKQTPDFDKLVFPNSWYEKYNLPKKECMNMKEFLKESPWMKRHQHFYSGRIEDIAPKPGGVRPILDAPEVPAITLVQNSFSDAPESTGQTVEQGPEGILKL